MDDRDSGNDAGDARLDVHEPSPGIGSGFLREYWQSQRALPRIQGPEVGLYYLQQGVRTVSALPGSSLISVLTIAVSLFLLAGFLLILQNVGTLLTEAGSTLFVTAYLVEEAEPEEVARFVRKLESSERVQKVEFVSKQRALELFREDLGSRSGFLEGLEENNPLPASVDITFRPDATAGSSIESMLEGLRAHAVVEELVYGSEWVTRMQSIVKVFRLFGIGSLIVALAIIMFLISNTIKLVIYARRDEIGIMQLVGASDSFVRIPFVLGGLLQGLVGSLCGLLLLKVGFLILNYEVRSSTIFGVALPDLVFLNVWAILAIIAIGLIVGAIGSLFALRKFMNV
jgi:cell division transport system permease protein